MQEQIEILKKFLEDNIEKLSDKEIEILNYQINYLQDCNEKYSKVMLEFESNPEIVEKAKSNANKIKGVINV